MRLLLFLLAFWHVWRAQRCSMAYRKHMERRAALMGRAGR